MTGKIFSKFLKDRIRLICFYLFNLICVISFFILSDSFHTEVFYPASIGMFLLIVYLIIDWLRYFPANRSMENMLNNRSMELEVHTEEQKTFRRLLQKVIREHTGKYHEMMEQNQERMYFLSHWMHHLKTPVSVMELMISKGKETDEMEEVLDKILQENRRLYSSIEQGLTMLRIEKIENDLEVKSVDLLHTLRKIINRRKREFIYQSIIPSIEWDEKEAYVVTDTKWNEILLDQIISNAIKYSSVKQGNKKLIFHIEKDEKFTTLSIIDEGAGIPPYDLERVFEPFFTGENGRKFANSTGIGLYLCKKIADKLGQTITISSEVSKGTTVNIRWVTGIKSGHS